MKRSIPWAALAVMIAIAAIAVFTFDASSVAHAHGLGSIMADAAAGAAVTEELLREFQAHNQEVKAALEKFEGKDSELAARLLEIEQKMVRRGSSGGGGHTDTWGAQVVRDQAFGNINGQQWKGRARFEVKSTAALTSASGGTAGDAGSLVAPDRQSGYIDLPRRKLRMRDVFSPGQTKSNLIQWPRQTVRSNNAATVAEGNLKPQSDMTFDLLDWPVRTIAHWMLASRQILDDAPALQSAIDSDLRYDLAYVEDNQLLNGGGTGTDLTGVYINATAFNAPFVPTAAGNLNKIDVLLLAIAQVQNLDYEPDFIAVNPLDWADIIVTKDEKGSYLGGGPFSTQAALLWTLPVVQTKAMAQNKFLVGPGKRGAQIFDRQEATVEISTEDSDNFRKNLVTLLCEERLAFVLKAAAAFVKGDFNEALAI